jgi:threonine dehydratase
VIGVEPAEGDDGARSFRSGRIETIGLPNTIADGARTTALGNITFALIQKHVDGFLTVTDAELLKSMFFLWERMKIVVEPTGTLAACALLEKKIDCKGKKVGVILSGGNVDVKAMAALL